MMDEKYMPLAIDYIEGRLNAGEEAELKHLIAEGKIDEQELQELALFYGGLPKAKEVEVPSERMRSRFQEALYTEQQKQQQALNWQNRLTAWWQQLNLGLSTAQLSFGLILLLLGVGIGYSLRPEPQYENQLSQLSTELQQMREVMMLSMLEQGSPTERLKAVNMGYEMNEADQKVINALLQTLNSDPNVNVRLAAVEALKKHVGKAQVREGLIQAIAQQDSPIVQIALADLMVELQEKQAVEPMQKLLKEKPVDEYARQKLENSIHVLI